MEKLRNIDRVNSALKETSKLRTVHHFVLFRLLKVNTGRKSKCILIVEDVAVKIRSSSMNYQVSRTKCQFY